MKDIIKEIIAEEENDYEKILTKIVFSETLEEFENLQKEIEEADITDTQVSILLDILADRINEKY